MSIGAQYIIKGNALGATGVFNLESIEIVSFSHDATFVATTTAAVKNDILPGLPNTVDPDQFTVKITYPVASIPALTATLDATRLLAVAAINTAYTYTLT